MSVMACSRRGCTNVFCVRHSRTYGTICNECFNELCSSGITKESQIVDFMSTTKPEFYEEAIREKLNRVFPILV